MDRYTPGIGWNGIGSPLLKGKDAPLNAECDGDMFGPFYYNNTIQNTKHWSWWSCIIQVEYVEGGGGDLEHSKHDGNFGGWLPRSDCWPSGVISMSMTVRHWHAFTTSALPACISMLTAWERRDIRFLWLVYFLHVDLSRTGRRFVI